MLLSKEKQNGNRKENKHMKKYNEIIDEINSIREERSKITERLNKKIDERFKKKTKKDELAEIDQEIITLQTALNDATIAEKLLINNAKIAMFWQTMPIALEIFNKYSGKSYGEKTEEKISVEIKQITGCIAYISKSYSQYKYVLTDLKTNLSIECGTKYINGEQKPLLINNKIQAINIEGIELFYINNIYFNDINSTIADLKRIYALAYEKQQELEKICTQFNALAVDGIENIYATKHIYKNQF